MMNLDPNVISQNVTATGLLKAGGGFAIGIIVNSHSSGTLKLWNSLTAALDGSITPQDRGLVMDTFSFPAGSGVYMFPAPIPFKNGLFATVGGTLNCQIIRTVN